MTNDPMFVIVAWRLVGAFLASVLALVFYARRQWKK